VLPGSKYGDLMATLALDNYLLPVIFGKVSSDREDAAWAMVKYFQHVSHAPHFLSEIINHEVEATRMSPTRPLSGAFPHSFS